MTRPIRLMTLAPGHFHAALVQKHRVRGIHPRAHVYAPLDDDLLAHLTRVAAFNNRADNPTAWELDVRAGDDYLERLLREQPGNAVVIAGRNRGKIDHILAAVANNLPVLADKPWVIEPEDFPKLEQLQRDIDLRDGLAWDVMTERFEITNILQRELMADVNVFGSPLLGTPDEPALTLESTHHLRKTVAGVPLRRPVWWFDAAEAGFALADVGTHLADLALWLLFPGRPIDYRRDIAVLDARAWPTPLNRGQLAALTGRAEFPEGLPIANDELLYQGNGTATFTIGGVHVKMTVLWDYEADSPGGDTHEAVARGTRSHVSIRSLRSPESGIVQPELFVEPVGGNREAILAAVSRRCERWRGRFPGVSLDDRGGKLRIVIPDALRSGHEEHFARVVREFCDYFHYPRQMPVWEQPNLLAKYRITTTAVRLAREKQANLVGSAGVG